jgi:Asp-tRNA(Asn)/Glu-tRNA(Gln) amidotransferase A subunit family amidase
VFARSVPDLALIAEQLMGYDERDPDMRPRARPDLVGIAAGEPPIPPHFAFVKTPAWEQAEKDTKSGFAELLAFLGDRVEEIDLGDLLQDAIELHRIIMEADLAKSFRREYERGGERLSPKLSEMIERGQRCLATDYNDAVERIAGLNLALDEIFVEHDAVITPAATGEAPAGLESTGSPVFCTPWSLCGVPSISVPILQGSHGMPVGVQLTAAKGDDARLLRTVRWLAEGVDEQR